MTDERKGSGQTNEGEGNKTAARHYNDAQAGFAKSGKVADKAREARDAIEGSEGKELEKAAAAGKSHSAGEDPALKR
jgi:hypothetical protein